MEKKSIITAIEFNEAQFTKRIVYRKGESTVFMLNFLPGQSLPTHQHPGTDIYILVMDGGGTFTVDSNKLEVSANDVLHFEGSEKMSFSNTTDESTTLYVVLTKIPSEKFAQDI